MIGTLKRMMTWCAPFKKRLYVGFLFSFINAIFIIIPVALTGYVMKMILMQMADEYAITLEDVLFVLALTVLSVIGRYVFTYLRSAYQDMIGYEVATQKRLELGNNLKNVPLSFLQKHPTGSLTSAVSTDLQFIEMHGIKMLDTIVNGYVSSILFLLIMGFYNWVIALISVIGLLGSYFFLNRISQKSKQNAEEYQRSRNVMTSATLEFVRGIPFVKSFKLDGLANEKLHHAFEKAKNINIKIETDFVGPNQAHLITLKITSIFIVMSSSLMALEGMLELPTMVMFIILSFTMFRGVEVMNDAMHILKVIDETFDKLEQIELSSKLRDEVKDIEVPNHTIRFSNVSFQYGSEKVLKDLSFTIPENQTTAFVGPSGSGKSTICHLIARFYDIQEGVITIGNVDIQTMSAESLLKNISIVFQKVYLFNDTIYNNISFGKPDATYKEVVEAAKKARCHDFIIKLPNGYNTIVGEAGATLSGGEKQRISIARSIIKDAPIIILDEATASMDPENEHLIQEAILELVHGKTAIMIAHRLKTIQHADQIIVLNKGETVQQGNHDKLLSEEGMYRQLVESRKKVETWTLKGDGNYE
ncbi:ABC transporter ATP-binding protein [Virgibacillus dokdonensis]|uniref:Lipid A export ATP-binding/permease protein MsbA n=1 Tax=Virgibacillus dokdonensis TaxID=302167 RepID=A0A2K9J2T2_9BACI|nr:ABC transporter ATP-binding protein [Virgibacillus dokdonensis]AUJ24331.1 Lipid A export ATP-binding/permease protein MsbA [Virgibacillus dokdonensis]